MQGLRLDRGARARAQVPGRGRPEAAVVRAAVGSSCSSIVPSYQYISSQNRGTLAKFSGELCKMLL